MDMSKLSDSDLQQIAKGDLRMVSEQGLRLLAGVAEQKQPDHFGDVAKEQSATENLIAGVGGAMKGIYLGGKQMLGLDKPGEVEGHLRAMKGLGTTTSGTVGQVAGTAIPAAATALIPGANTLTGAALTGAVMGALDPVGEGESRLKNMAISAGAGAAGQKAAQMIGRLNKPVNSTLTPEKQALAARAAQEGIPLNVAQKTGSKPLQIIDSVLDNMPLTADKNAVMKDAARQKFNAAVGRTFGVDEARITPQVIETAKKQIGDQFTELSKRNNLVLDNQVVNEVTTLIDDLGKFDTPDVARIITNYADDMLAKSQNGTISGEAYRKFDSALGRKMRSTQNGDLRHALGQLQESVRNAMDRSINQADSAQWKNIRRQYANLKEVEKIAAKDVEGNVSPKLLWNAVNQRKGNLRDIAEVGKAFVNEVPDSGTAQRAFYQRLIENPLTALWQQGVGGMSVPLQKALNSKAGERYFTQGLLSPSPQAATLGKATSIGVPIGLLQLSQ